MSSRRVIVCLAKGPVGVFLPIVEHIVTSDDRKPTKRASIRHFGTTSSRAFVKPLHVYCRGFLVLRQGAGGVDRCTFSVSEGSHTSLSVPTPPNPPGKTLQKHLPLQFLRPSSNVRPHRCHLYLPRGYASSWKLLPCERAQFSF